MVFRGGCLVSFVVATTVFFAAADAWGTARTWQNLNTGDWLTPSNWNGGLPDSSTDALIGNGGTATINEIGASCTILLLGSTTDNKSGTVQLSAGGAMSTTLRAEIGNSGPGNFTQSGGTNSFGSIGALELGNSGGAIGTYNLTAGSLSTDYTFVGNSGPGSFKQSGGTHSVSSELYLAYDTGSSGTYTLSVSGLLSAPIEIIAGASGTSGTGSFTQSGGTNSVSGSVFLAEDANTTGTYNLNGGLLTLGGLTAGSGSATFNFSGGTFQAGSSSVAAGVPIVLGPAGSSVVFDTSGNTLTLSAGLSGSSSITKRGKGLLILSGPASYHGSMNVAEGMLDVASASALPNGSSLSIGASASLIFGDAAEADRASGKMQAVPEPSTLALLGLGAVGLLACACQRMSQAADNVRRAARRLQMARETEQMPGRYCRGHKVRLCRPASTS